MYMYIYLIYEKCYGFVSQSYLPSQENDVYH